MCSLIVLYSCSGRIKNYEPYYIPDTGKNADKGVRVTFFGVSTLLFDDGETQILIDGFFSRPSISKTLFTKIKSDTTTINQLVAKHKMNRVQGIFVTHSHYEHAMDVAYVANKTGAKVYGSASTRNIALGGNVPEKQLSLFHLNCEVPVGKFTVQAIPTIHSSNRPLHDEGEGIEAPIQQPVKASKYLEGGSYDFYIKHEGRTIYVKASPNFIAGALDCFSAEVVFIGVGTINKKSKAWRENYYKQTVGKLDPELVIPIHWDNFFRPVSQNLSLLPWFAKGSAKDLDFFIGKTAADSIKFGILQGEKSTVLFK